MILLHKLTRQQTELYVKTGILGMIQDKNGLIKPEIGCFISNKVDSGEAQKKKRENMFKKNENITGIMIKLKNN